MSDNEKVTALVDGINADLDDMEAAAEHADLIKKTASAMDRLLVMDGELTTQTGYSAFANPDEIRGNAAALRNLLPVKTEDMDRRLTMAAKALDAADILPGIPVDDIKAVLHRAEEIFAAKPKASKAGGVRGIGEPIRVECDCNGFTRESSNGDWTSIRFQAKRHAAECTVANPTNEFLNDLDSARVSVVNQRLDYRTGGLLFSLPDQARPVPAPAE